MKEPVNNEKDRIDAEAAHQRRIIGAEADTHVDETLLGDYADGNVSAADREIVETHLEDCETCREDLADLQQVRWQLRQPRRRLAPFLIAAAAVAAIVLLVLQFLPKPAKPLPQQVHHTTPSPTPAATTTSYGRANWDELVRNAVQTGSIAKPSVLASVERAPESIRGQQSGHNPLTPSGVIIESDQPLLAWPRQSPTASYVVTILDGDNVVAQSPVLKSLEWHLSKPLPRDRALLWQIEVRDGPSVSVIPHPPDPPAVFRIISAEGARDLAAARRSFPSDHRLLGLLYAHYGMVREAREELGKAGDAAMARLSTAIAAW